MTRLTRSTRIREIKRNWHLVDAEGKILGRMATEIAVLLIGKTKKYFVSHLDCGDHVVVINCAKVTVSGKKQTQKLYQLYSGYPGGLKKKSFIQTMRENPERIINQAVSGMLPNNKLRQSMLKRLYVFTGDSHPYTEKFKGVQ